MAAGSRISANDMGAAVMHDPQFRMPDKPKVSRHIAVIDMPGDGIVFDGSPEKQWLRGKSAKQLLPQLIELADGTRTVEDILQRMDSYPAPFVYNSLALLYSRGLLYDGSEEKDDHTPFHAFVQRHMDLTRVNHTTGQVFERLRNHGVYLFGQSASRLKKELDKYPLTVKVSEYPRAAEKGLALYIHRYGEMTDELRSFGTRCLQEGVPWILLTIHNDILSFGPYFEKDETLCVECLEAQWDSLDLPTAVESSDSCLHDAAFAYAAVEIVHFLGRLSPSSLVYGIKRLHLPTFQSTMITVSRMPYCKLCDPAEGRGPVLNLASQYEEYVAFPSQHLLNPKDHQHHYRPSNLKLTKTSNVYPSCRPISLPREEQTDERQPLYLLSQFMLYTAGFKSEYNEQLPRVFRWAPTGGNLGSVGLYYISLATPGLPSGIYYYQASTHTLAVIRESNVDIGRMFVRPVEEEPEPEWGYIVHVGALARVRKKYNEFAYRIIHLDAGASFAQAGMVAHALHMRMKLVEGWDQRILCDWFHIDEELEIPTVVSAIGRGWNP